MSKIMDDALYNLPTNHSRNLIEGILKEEKFKNYVLNVSCGSAKGENYLGEIYRVEVNGTKEDGSVDFISFILKMAPDSAILRKNVPITTFYEKEYFSYTKILPVFMGIQNSCKLANADRIKHAKLFGGDCEIGKELLVFEDLAVKGYGLYEKNKTLDYDHVLLSFKTLARLHSLSIILKIKQPDLFAELSKNAFKGSEFSDSFCACLHKNLSMSVSLMDNDNNRDKVAKYLSNSKSELIRFVSPETAAPFNVLVHGDCWSNNFLFKYKDEKVVDMILLDWQLIKCASPIIDIAFLVYLVMDEDMRTKHYEQMLDVYYDTLSNNISKMGYDISQYYPNNVYRDQIKNIMPFGFLLSTAVLPLVYPTDGTEIHDVINEENSSDGISFSKKCLQFLKDNISFSIRNKII